MTTEDLKNIPTQEVNNQAKSKKSIFKIIFLVLLVIVAGEAIWAGGTLFTPVQKTKVNTIEPLSQGWIILKSDKFEFKQGDDIPVDIKIVTGGREVDSIDVSINFDPKILEATAATSFDKGNIFKEYPFVDINKSGVVKISAITPPGQKGFLGIGNLGRINFRARSNGQAKITVDFKKESTTDSNIIEAGTTRDILGQVSDLDIAVGENLMAGQRDGNRACDGYTQYCQDSSGKTGTQACNGGILQNSSCVFDPKYTSSCSECKSVTAK